MGLQPLEFSDCYLDSPWFRERIRAGSGAGEDQQVLQRAHQRWEEPHRCHQKVNSVSDDVFIFTLEFSNCKSLLPPVEKVISARANSSWALQQQMDLNTSPHLLTLLSSPS
ncbi:hypothetical protein LEMLEM_LOCUS25576 [Lemmus lemmus]